MTDEQIIHLYILDECTHKCPLCCNKQYDTKKIQVVTVEELSNAEIVCLTGGEPFLLNDIDDFAKSIKKQYPNIKQIYVYTCGDSLYFYLKNGHTLNNIDGVNISPKNKFDVSCVNKLFQNNTTNEQIFSLTSNRLYLFPNVRKNIDLEILKDKNIEVIEREWQEEFKPNSGIFRRLPILMNIEN